MIDLNQISGASAATFEHTRIRKAAQEFEGLMLASLLGPLEQSFASVPGQENDAGRDQYQYLATQAVALAISAAGGIGIANLIVRQLDRGGGLG